VLCLGEFLRCLGRAGEHYGRKRGETNARERGDGARSSQMDLAKKRFSFRATTSPSRVWHSQMTRTRQPALRSVFLFSVSRTTLRPSFAVQNSLRVAGKVDFEHPLC